MAADATINIAVVVVAAVLVAFVVGRGIGMSTGTIIACEWEKSFVKTNQAGVKGVVLKTYRVRVCCGGDVR